MAITDEIRSLQQELLHDINRILTIGVLDEETKAKLSDCGRRIIEPRRAKVQLLGESQAGKTTFISTLLQGEAFTPTGVGHATTAVATRIVRLSDGSDSYAVVEWKSPEQLFRSFSESLSRMLTLSDLLRLQGRETQAKLSSLASPERQVTELEVSNVVDLEREDHRRYLIERLLEKEAAWMEKGAKSTPSAKLNARGAQLKAGIAIIHHYEKYVAIRRTPQQRMPAHSAVSFIKHAPGWSDLSRSGTTYTWEHIKCLYVKEVLVHAPGDEVLDHVELIDTPGFNVSRYDDEVCLSTASEVDAVLLFLGATNREVGLNEVEMIPRLKEALRDNLYIVWNSHTKSRKMAGELLGSALAKIEAESGIRVNQGRTALCNVRMALRAIQLARLDLLSEHTLNALCAEWAATGEARTSPTNHEERKLVAIEMIKDQLVQSYGTFFDKARNNADDQPLDQILHVSGWSNEVKRLIRVVKWTQFARQLSQVAMEVGTIVDSFRLGFPSKAEIEAWATSVAGLEWVVGIEELATQGLAKQVDQYYGLETFRPKVVEAILKELSGDYEFLENSRKKIKRTCRSATTHIDLINAVSAGLRDDLCLRIGRFIDEASEPGDPRIDDWSSSAAELIRANREPIAKLNIEPPGLGLSPIPTAEAKRTLRLASAEVFAKRDGVFDHLDRLLEKGYQMVARAANRFFAWLGIGEVAQEETIDRDEFERTFQGMLESLIDGSDELAHLAKACAGSFARATASQRQTDLSSWNKDVFERLRNRLDLLKKGGQGMKVPLPDDMVNELEAAKKAVADRGSMIAIKAETLSVTGDIERGEGK